MSEFSMELLEDGQTIVISAEAYDVRLLETFGARKLARQPGKMQMPYRLREIRYMQQHGHKLLFGNKLSERVKSDEKLETTQNYLQSAQDLKKQAQHPKWDKLLGHQRVGVGYLSVTPRAFLVYSPRLGKTPTSVVAAEILKLDRILFVTPKTLFSTIERTIKSWSEDGQDAETFISRGLPPKQLGTDRAWVITNPESISLKQDAWAKFLKQESFDLIIWDESIMYKSHKAKRQKAAVELSKLVPRAWLLTGNPSGRYMDQLFGQLQILRPDVFTSYWRFVNNWCYTQDSPWATEVVGNKNPEKLREYLSDMMISRTPVEVPVLPELNFEPVYVDLSPEQEELIDELDLTMALRNPENPEEPAPISNILTLMTRTAQIVSCPSSLGFTVTSAKQDTALDIIENGEKPVLVWFQFVDSLKHFAEVCRQKKLRVAEIHGGVSDKQRQQAIDSFNSGQQDVICVQLQTGKFGLDLTAARTIIYYDRSFDLDSWIQSTNRGRLIGMSQDLVAAGYVLHGGYTDFLIDKILMKKVGSLTEMGLSDLLEVTKSTSNRVKPRKARKGAKK